ncbi:unnamed protein product, partial [Allacma fusca]
MLPDSFKNPFTFAFLWIHEIIWHFSFSIASVITLTTGILFLERTGDNIVEEISALNDNRNDRKLWVYKLCSSFCTETSLLILSFNMGYSFTIYVFKNITINVLVICSCVSILSYADNFPVVLFCLVLGIFITALFAMTFDKGFGIPGNIKTLKLELLLGIRSSDFPPNERRVLERRIKAI